MSTTLSVTRYVRLYTLHQVETPGDLVVLRVRIETLRYSFAPLTGHPAYPYPDEIFVGDPRQGARLVREAVLPRLNALLDTPDPFAELNLIDDRAAWWWPRYAAARGLPAQPVEVPGIAPPPHDQVSRPRLPAVSQTSQRLAAIQRALETIRTAAHTAATLAALWQNWQIGQARRALLDAQRKLLQDAIRAQLAGQDQALQRGLDPDFVRGYLADHASDPADDIIFGSGEDSHA